MGRGDCVANSCGQIDVALVNIVGNPAVNGIEIVARATPAPVPAPTPTPNVLCIGGSACAPAHDDEFSHDTTLNYSPNPIVATPQPNGAIWSSRAWDFESDGSRKNIGTDDADYTDPTRGVGPYSHVWRPVSRRVLRRRGRQPARGMRQLIAKKPRMMRGS